MARFSQNLQLVNCPKSTLESPHRAPMRYRLKRKDIDPCQGGSTPLVINWEIWSHIVTFLENLDFNILIGMRLLLENQMRTLVP